MKLTDKVAAVLSTLDYQVRECLDSTRHQLHHAGSIYCLLSRSNDSIYCPLQHTEGTSYVSNCLRQDYLRELSSRNIEK